MQCQMRQGHSATNLKAGVLHWMNEGCSPLPRPTNCEDRSFPFRLNVEEREKVTGRSAAAGLEIQASLFPQHPGHRNEVVDGARWALCIVNRGITVRKKDCI